MNYKELNEKLKESKNHCPQYIYCYGNTGPTGPMGPTGPQGVIGPTGPKGTSLPLPNATFINIERNVEPDTYLKLIFNADNGQNYIRLENNELVLEGPGVYYVNHVLTGDILPNDYIRVAPFLNGRFQDIFLTYSNTGSNTTSATTSAGYLYSVSQPTNLLRFQFSSQTTAKRLYFLVSVIKIQ